MREIIVSQEEAAILHFAATCGKPPQIMLQSSIFSVLLRFSVHIRKIRRNYSSGREQHRCIGTSRLINLLD